MGPGERRAAALLIAVISVNASYTVLIPFVQELGTRAGAGPAVIAGTFTLFAAAKTLTQPVGGWWVDRWRPGPVACLSLLVCAVGTAITALARDPATLLTGRIVWGVGEGLVSPALYAGMSALCARYEIPVSRMMGNFGSAAVAGFLLGPLVTGVAAPVGIEGLFLAGAALTVVTAFGLLYAVPAANAVPAAASSAASAASAASASSASASASSAVIAPTSGAVPEAPVGRWWVQILALGVLDMSTFMIYAALEPVLPLYLGSAHDGSARGVISAVFAVGLAASGLCIWALGRWTGRMRLVTLVTAGLGLVSLGLPGLALSPRLLPVSAWFVIYMVGYSVLFLAARRGVLELKAAATHQGKAFGLFGMVSDVGNIVGPALGVLLWQLTGRGVFVVLGAASSALLIALLAAAARRTPPVARRPVPSAPASAATPVPGPASGPALAPDPAPGPASASAPEPSLTV